MQQAKTNDIAELHRRSIQGILKYRKGLEASGARILKYSKRFEKFEKFWN